MNSIITSECFISVDVETSGPVPGEYSLLSIGATGVFPNGNDDPGFYCTLKPLEGAKADGDAMAVSGLDIDVLRQAGAEPVEGMRQFEAWCKVVSEGAPPVFVGFNAAFDWSFVNYYFHRFLGRNPFGFSALDIKSVYMGATGCSWADTRSSAVSKALGVQDAELSHHALDDARKQAMLFAAIRQLRVPVDKET